MPTGSRNPEAGLVGPETLAWLSDYIKGRRRRGIHPYGYPIDQQHLRPEGEKPDGIGAEWRNQKSTRGKKQTMNSGEISNPEPTNDGSLVRRVGQVVPAHVRLAAALPTPAPAPKPAPVHRRDLPVKPSEQTQEYWDQLEAADCTDNLCVLDAPHQHGRDCSAACACRRDPKTPTVIEVPIPRELVRPFLPGDSLNQLVPTEAPTPAQPKIRERQYPRAKVVRNADQTWRIEVLRAPDKPALRYPISFQTQAYAIKAMPWAMERLLRKAARQDADKERKRRTPDNTPDQGKCTKDPKRGIAGCGRPMRPTNTVAADWPGTVTRQRAGWCQNCESAAKTVEAREAFITTPHQ